MSKKQATNNDLLHPDKCLQLEKVRKYDIIINIKKVVKSKNGGQCERYAD